MMRLFLLWVCFTIYTVPCAYSQSQIKALVNDDLISELDLDQRVDFIALTSAADTDSPEIREQILKQMIDEKLKVQEAKRLDLSVSQPELEQAVSVALRQNGFDEQKLRQMLIKQNLPFSILEDQIKSDLLFVRAIRKEAGKKSEISDMEVQAKLAEIETSIDQKRYLLSEIVLPIADIDQENAVYGAAIKLIMSLREGASFESLATQFSSSSSAQKGGLLGWVTQDSLDPLVQEELALMDQGQISTPIKTVSGYVIVLLRAKQEPTEQAQEQDIWHIAQIFIPQTDDKTRTALLDKINKTNGSCADFITLATQEKSTPLVDLGEIAEPQLPLEVKVALEKVDIQEPTEPVLLKEGELVFMACSKEKKINKPTKESIKNLLETKRLEMMVTRRLRDLRRNALLEIR